MVNLIIDDERPFEEPVEEHLTEREWVQMVRREERWLFDELWGDTEDAREREIDNQIRGNIFNLREFFGLDPYPPEPEVEDWNW